MMYSASDMRRRAEIAARNGCRTMQTTEDPDEKWPNTSAETRDAYRSTQNFLSGACACGLPLGDTPMYFCPLHACCMTCAEAGPHTMRKSRHSNTCKINGCTCELAAVATRNLKAEEQSAFVKEMLDKLRESLEHEQHRDTSGQDARDEAMGRDPADRAGRSGGGKAKIGDIEDPEEKAEAQAAAKENRLRLAKKKRIDETREEFEILLDHSIQMHVDADHPEAPNLVAKKRKIDEFIENGPPKKKGGRRPKAAAAAASAAAGPSGPSIPTPNEQWDAEKDEVEVNLDDMEIYARASAIEANEDAAESTDDSDDDE
jgi:hypothetical protein